MSRARTLALTLPLQLILATAATAQWTNRYPKVEGLSHHVYLEGYELPTLTVGPMDPAERDGTVAVASRGWIWLAEADNRSARRLTRGAGLDSRPTWSPDGSMIAFVRDDSRQTSIVTIDVATGEETIAIEETAIILDPAYSKDGRHLYYSSSTSGDPDLWRLALDTGEKERLTSAVGIERRPIPHPDGDRLVYLRKRGQNQVRILSLSTGEDRVLYDGRLLSQLQPALSPDGRTLALNVPDGRGGWELRLVAVEQPGPSILLFSGGLPLAPSWSTDGEWIYFSEADASERMVLKRVAKHGGPVQRVSIESWDWGQETGRLSIRTSSGGSLVPARLSVVDQSGHAAVAEGQKPFFDGQNGTVFFYGDGVVEVEVPAGPVRVEAARGLAPTSVADIMVEAGRTTEVSLEITPMWSAQDHGWLSGDHHFHMNYGGSYNVDPDDLTLFAAAEDLDVMTPLLANLHNRFEQQEFWGQNRLGSRPWIQFGQEVRSHFLGHVSLLDIEELFWPWVWGPGYQVYGEDDRPNAVVLDHGRRQGGLNTYVHPVGNSGPFDTDPPTGIPTGFIPDAVLGYVDGLEIACLWSNEIGTTELWYRLLNIGVPIAPTAGTDVMTDFYRTMAVGATRVYVNTGGASTFSDYMDGLKAGRSFVTTGPMLDFSVEGAGPGAVVEGSQAQEWNLDLHTAVSVDRVEVVVNGAVVWAGDEPENLGSTSYSGSIEVPAGGWIAARALGPAPDGWPAMGNHAFAHTAPVWLEAVGSTDASAQRQAASELLVALSAARQRLEAGYEGVDIPELRAHFDRARASLEEATR